MKQFTKSLLKIQFTGQNVDNFEKVEFAFSQDLNKTPLKTATYPSEATMKISDDVIGVIWTAEETALFEADKYLYIDTRITLTGVEYQPETSIAKVKMKPTLFEGGE